MHIDIFKSDGFTLAELSAAINLRPYAPTRIGQLGLFQTDGMRTKALEIEYKQGVLTLVPAKDRGAPATPKTLPRRNTVHFDAIHLPQMVSISADEVQSVRAFGSESDTEMATELLREKTDVALLDLDVTLEWQRLGAIKGQVLDADGTTVLEDLFVKFGVSQNTHNFQFSSSTLEVATEMRALKRKIEAELGAMVYSEIRIFAGKNWFDAYVSHTSVKDAYRLYQNSSVLRADNRTGFYFSDNVVTEEYRGSVGATQFVGDDEAYAVPIGVPQLFICRYAPAPYMETVNTKGLARYQKIRAADWDKGVESEIQSNPVHLCTRPRAVVKLTKS